MERKDWNKTNFFTEAINLKDILGYSDNEIYDKVFCLYTDLDTVRDNFDFFLRVLSIMELNGFYSVNVDRFETVKFINDHLPDKRNIVISILDDYENQDRSEIRTYEIEKCQFSVPLSYVMWGIDFDDLLLVSGVSYHQNALNYNGNQYMDRDTLKRIRDIVLELKGKGRFTDLQIIILVSNYLQKNVEYLAKNVDKDGKYIAKVDEPVDGLDDEVGLVETVLFKKYGLCTGIANSTMLLLNNPEFGINARTIFNRNHAFNIVKFNGEYYFLDNTWNITRSKAEFAKAIKPLKFNPTYLLYGKKTFEHSVDNRYLCDNPNISLVKDKGIKQREIMLAKRNMHDRVSFDYPGEIVHPISKISF